MTPRHKRPGGRMRGRGRRAPRNGERRGSAGRRGLERAPCSSVRPFEVFVSTCDYCEMVAVPGWRSRALRYGRVHGRESATALRLYTGDEAEQRGAGGCGPLPTRVTKGTARNTKGTINARLGSGLRRGHWPTMSRAGKRGHLLELRFAVV